MELDWVDKYEQIGAVIFAPGAGATGFEALGEIINGSVNPSGKTVDTFVKDLTETPYYNNMGLNAYTNVEDLKEQIAANDPAYEGSMGFVNYAEGIYVGYKFYETAAEEGLINMRIWYSIHLDMDSATQPLTNRLRISRITEILSPLM